MTVDEIFNKIASHMIEGIMYHDEFAKAFDFLGLWGYARCQDYHHLEEESSYRCLSHYYAKHYFKLLQPEEVHKPEVIPQSWFKYTTQDVDPGTKKTAIRDLMNKWIAWEKSTKELYQVMRQELTTMGEIAASLYIDECIKDVTKELRHAQRKSICLETIGYDLITIMSEQEELYNKYTKKLGW